MTFLILPDRNREVGKILMPMRRREWIRSSQRESFDPLNVGTVTRWRLTARTHDGVPVWRGWFEDRDDADAFLWAIATNTARIDPTIWRLPTPHWNNDLDPDLVYDLATVTIITGSPGSNVNTAVPSDWNNANNEFEAIGGGGGGGGTNGYNGGGGAGGMYCATPNVTLTPGGTVITRVGANGAAGAASGTSSGTGTAGGDSWVNSSTLAGSSVGAKGGPPGTRGASGSDNGQGGDGVAITSGIGTTKYKGGDGSNGSQGNWGGAGGGAGGPGGAGGNASGALGGTGGGGLGGAGGTGNGGAGGNGTEWGTAGSGGGSAGRTTVSGTAPQPGGNYGGAGSGPRNSGAAAGSAGRQGIIVMTYEPAKARGFNLAQPW